MSACFECSNPTVCEKEKRCNFAPAFMKESLVLKKLHVHWTGDHQIHGMDNFNYEGYVAPPEFPYDRILMKNVFTRVLDPWALMNDLYYWSKPGALIAIDEPYGSHDSADELRRRRRVFADTFREFEPRFQFRMRTFYLDGFFFSGSEEPEQIGAAVANLRNVVKGFTVELRVNKPLPEGYTSIDPATGFKII